MTNTPTHQQGSAQATILLAENDMSVAVPLIIGLLGEGFQVLHAVDGHWALELARAASGSCWPACGRCCAGAG